MLAPDPCQPPWTPSGVQGDDSATYMDKECGNRELSVPKAVMVNGSPVVIAIAISIPHLPYVNMLDPRGNVLAVPIANNRVARQGSVSYRMGLLSHLRSRKWVRWDYVPEGGMEFEPAQVGLSPDEWGVRREELRKERELAARTEAQAYSVKAGDKDLVEAIKGNNEALTRVLDRLVSGGGGGRRGKGGDGDA